MTIKKTKNMILTLGLVGLLGGCKDNLNSTLPKVELETEANKFTRDMILPSSFRDYLTTTSSQYGTTYVLKGVQAEGNGSTCIGNIVDNVNVNFPNAEVVTDFSYTDDNICYGTAVIPKK